MVPEVRHPGPPADLQPDRRALQGIRRPHRRQQRLPRQQSHGPGSSLPVAAFPLAGQRAPEQHTGPAAVREAQLHGLPAGGAHGRRQHVGSEHRQERHRDDRGDGLRRSPVPVRRAVRAGSGRRRRGRVLGAELEGSSHQDRDGRAERAEGHGLRPAGCRRHLGAEHRQGLPGRPQGLPHLAGRRNPMAANPESVLDSVKQTLGFQPEYQAFDLDILLHAISAIERQIEMLEFRINVAAEGPPATVPVWWDLTGLADFYANAAVGDFGFDSASENIYVNGTQLADGYWWDLTGLADFPAEALTGEFGYDTFTGDVWRKTA